MEAHVLTVVARATAHDIDSSLPALPLSEWLRDVTRTDDLQWSINPTCGEAPGKQGRFASTHVCASTLLQLANGERAGVLLAIVRTAGGEIRGAPMLRLVFVETNDGDRYRDSDRLSQLPRLITGD